MSNYSFIWQPWQLIFLRLVKLPLSLSFLLLTFHKYSIKKRHGIGTKQLLDSQENHLQVKPGGKNKRKFTFEHKYWMLDQWKEVKWVLYDSPTTQERAFLFNHY